MMAVLGRESPYATTQRAVSPTVCFLLPRMLMVRYLGTSITRHSTGTQICRDSATTINVRSSAGTTIVSSLFIRRSNWSHCKTPVSYLCHHQHSPLNQTLKRWHPSQNPDCLRMDYQASQQKSLQ